MAKRNKTTKRQGGNRTKWTLKKRREFLEVLRTSCNVTLSARNVGLSRSGAYEAKERINTFSQAWDEAVAEAVDLLEGEARRRAFHGADKPVIYQGQLSTRVDPRTGETRPLTVKEYSDLLLIFLLKAHRPHKYRERHEISGPDSGPIEIRQIERVIVDP